MKLSLYIHIPFCSSKCGYCDFYSIPVVSIEDSHSLQRRLLNAVITEIAYNLESIDNPEIESIFIGGGTPSVIYPELFSDFLSKLDLLISDIKTAGCEFTSEANTESCSPEFLSAAAGGGVNRISLGVQSFDPKNLGYIGRNFKQYDIFSSVAEIRAAWKERFSIDIISGLNNRYMEDLELAVQTGVDHISVYQLSIEEGTPLSREIQSKIKAAPEESLQSSAISDCFKFLESKGFNRYEISNYAVGGMECRHNIRYWRMQSYLGTGPSAVSSFYEGVQKKRIENPRNVWEYMDSVENNNGCCSSSNIEIISDFDFMIEHFIMGYRMIDGMDEDVFRERFGAISSFFIPETTEKWMADGMMNDNLSSLNERGLLFLDRFLFDVYDEISEKRGNCKNLNLL